MVCFRYRRGLDEKKDAQANECRFQNLVPPDRGQGRSPPRGPLVSRVRERLADEASGDATRQQFPKEDCYKRNRSRQRLVTPCSGSFPGDAGDRISMSAPDPEEPSTALR